MRTIHILLLLFFFLFATSSASAESDNKSPYKGGLNYIKLKKPTSRQAPPEKTQTHPEQPVTEKSTSRVWKKYQALAAGQTDEHTQKSEAQEKPETTVEKPKLQQKSTGIAAIIEQYQETKQSRSQMHTINTGASERFKKAQEEKHNHAKQ